MEYPGAKEVGIEFYSLSKSYNLTGARVSLAVGNKQVIDAFKLLRSQYDFGMFEPIQKAAIAALTGPQDGVKKQCMLYQERRDALCGGLRPDLYPGQRFRADHHGYERLHHHPGLCLHVHAYHRHRRGH